MSLDLIRHVRLPKEVSKEEFERYFSPVVGKPGAYLPTKAYLDAFFKYDDHEEKWYDWYANHQIKVEEKCDTGGVEPAHTWYDITDVDRFIGGDMLLDPEIVSKLFPNMKIEVRQSLDGEWEQLLVYMDGREVEARFLWTEEEKREVAEALKRDRICQSSTSPR